MKNNIRQCEWRKMGDGNGGVDCDDGLSRTVAKMGKE